MKFSAPAISATDTFWKDTHALFFFFSFLPRQTETLSPPIISTPAHLPSFMLQLPWRQIHSYTLETRRLFLGRLFISWFQPPASLSLCCSCLLLRVQHLHRTPPHSSSPPLLVPYTLPCLFTFSVFFFSLFSPTVCSLSYLSCLSTRPFALSAHISSRSLALPGLCSFPHVPSCFHWQLYLPLCVAASPVVHPPSLHLLIWPQSTAPTGATPATWETPCEGITATKCLWGFAWCSKIKIIHSRRLSCLLWYCG